MNPIMRLCLTGLLLAFGSMALAGYAFQPDNKRSSIAVIDAQSLPREARETLALIKRGGPFPYRKDGTTFSNRERILPTKERGFYKEYTVRTPGAKNRGARRIVAGGGIYYYTDDHYASFKRIQETS